MDLEAMAVRRAAGAGGGPDGSKREEARLRDACKQFEGLLLGMMLKESLREKLAGESQDAASGFDQFKDYCVEQVAHSMAESSSMGIADQLYEQMKQQGAER